MDTTEIVVGVLRDALQVPVSTEIPSQRPDRQVTVDLSGGSADPFLNTPRYQLMCWGQSEIDAHGIALACVEALWTAAEEHPLLSACQLVSMARDEWTATGQARYLVTVDLTINEE